MFVCVANGFALFRTSFDEKYDLIQKFRGLDNGSILYNQPVDFMESGLMQKNKWDYWHIDVPFALNTDEAVPAFINDGFIGGNHGFYGAITVYAPAHNKTFADAGTLWEDETGVRFTLLRVLDEDTLLFISENIGSIEQYEFVQEIKGKLSFVDKSSTIEDIVCIEQFVTELKRTIRHKSKRVVAFVGGQEIKVRGEVSCDCAEIREEYDIINPATVADALRKARPNTGFNRQVDLADYGEPMVSCRLTYRVTEDGTVLIFFDYKKRMNVRFQKFMGVMSQEKLDVYRGGIWRYFAKTLPFTTAEGNFDFSQPRNLVNSPFPKSKAITKEYWENAHSPCERVVDYFRDECGQTRLAFACGYLPIYDGHPAIRSHNVSTAMNLVHTRKYYPTFVEGDIQSLKGIGYKKYFIPKTEKSSWYTIDFENKTYVYVDVFEKNNIVIPYQGEVLVFEKSDEILYTITENKIVVYGEKGYAVFVVEKIKEEVEQ